MERGNHAGCLAAWRPLGMYMSAHPYNTRGLAWHRNNEGILRGWGREKEHHRCFSLYFTHIPFKEPSFTSTQNQEKHQPPFSSLRSNEENDGLNIDMHHCSDRQQQHRTALEIFTNVCYSRLCLCVNTHLHI